MNIRILAPLGLAVITFVSAEVSELWGTYGEFWNPASRLPDFSFAGYRSGEVAIPTPAAVANVMDFGAVGDGIADDTTAFENAIAATDNGAILIPAGRFKITRVLYIRKSNIVLRGAGQGLSTLVFPKHLTELLGPPPGTAGLESWSWGGGLIWVEGTEITTKLADVTANAARGAKILTVSSTAGLAVGQIIRLTMTDPDGSLGRHIHADQLNAHPTLVGRRLVRFPSKIAAISGSEITLERPLRHDVKTHWSPEIRSFSGQLEEVGIEDFTIEFPTRQYKGHFNEDGFNGIWMDGVANSWVRNLTVHNSECGIMLERSIFSTVDNVSITADVGNRLNISGTYYTGHHGIQLRRSDDCMVSNFSIPTRTYHDLTVEDTTGCVYMKGSGVDLNFDHHTYLPHENLFTEINIGTGTRHFASSGSRNPESAARETIWNMASTNPVTTLPNPSPSRGLWPQANFIGFNTTLATSKDPVLPWIEAITPASLTPSNLYQAQLTRRLTPPAVVPRTLTWDGTGVGTAGAQGGSGTWNTNTTSNWWNGSENEVWPTSGGTDDNAVFAGTAGTVTVATSGVAANDITVSTPSYVFSGGPIILNGDSPAFTISGGSTCNIESIVTGSAGLTKSGPSTLQLRAANRYQGDTRVLQGILLIGLSNNRLPVTTRLILGDGANSGTFQMNSRSQQVGGLLTSGTGTANRVINTNAATTTFTVNIANDADTHLFNGILGGGNPNDNNYNFVKSGLGRQILAGDSNYTGATTINSGTLQIGNDGPSGTLGPANITNNGILRFDRTGTLTVPNEISGSGSLRVDCPANLGTIELRAANTFECNVSITAGTLRVTHNSALGTTATGTTIHTGAKLQLQGTSLNIAENLTIGTGSSGATVENLSGENILSGTITRNGSLTFVSNSGKLTIQGNIGNTNNSLNLQGEGNGEISGAINTAFAVNKTGNGTWTLSGPSSHTNSTTVNSGKLVLSNTLAGPLTVFTGTLAPQGTPTSTSSLNIQPNGRLEVRPGDTLNIGGSVTLTGNLDIIAPPGLAPGTSYTILNKTSAGSISGSFSGKPEGSTFSASGYNWIITYKGGNGNDLALTIHPDSDITQWRITHFGTTENTGNAANNSDPNNDGENNLLEFATGQNPHANTRALTSVDRTTTSLEFTYTRSMAAFDDGLLFTVEYTCNLAPPWTSAGPGSIIIDGPLQTLTAIIPEGISECRFARLKITSP